MLEDYFCYLSQLNQARGNYREGEIEIVISGPYLYGENFNSGNIDDLEEKAKHLNISALTGLIPL